MIVSHPWPCVNNIHMVDPKHPSIEKMLSIITPISDIAVGIGRIDSGLSLMEVISCIIDMHDAVAVHSIVFEENMTDIEYGSSRNSCGPREEPDHCSHRLHLL